METLQTESRQPAEFLATADRIAHRLCRDAIWSADACTWMQWTTQFGDANSPTIYATIDGELYGGTAGVALFLARYFRLRPSRHVEATLRGALNHALQSLPALPPSYPGLYAGAAGIGFATLEAGQMLGDPSLMEKALDALDRVFRNAPLDDSLDIIVGSAGLISVALRAAASADREHWMQHALHQGDHLIASARKTAAGWSWPAGAGASEPDLTGFAHGTAGIATALLELHHATGAPRFLEATEQAWRYERTHFSPEHRNWPDFRYPATADRPQLYGMAWCHGAVGIGFARLRAWELGHRDPLLAREIETAISVTQDWLIRHLPSPADFSLCHGMAGNAELLVSAALTLDRPELLQDAAEVGRSGWELFERLDQPWPCGNKTDGETPNLMLGLAGIGLFYLRLHAPREVESILLIRPMPDDAAPDDAAPDDAAPDDAAPGNAAPGNAAPGNAAPGNAIHSSDPRPRQ